MSRDNNINTFRFLGAFLVLFGHTFVLFYGPGGGEDPISELIKHYAGYRAKLPGIGVAIFFVLSGYLITRSYLARHSLLAFVEARVLRIYPALWVTLLLTVFVLGPIVTAQPVTEYFSDPLTFVHLITNAKLYPAVVHKLPGMFLDNPRAGGVNGSLWTLPVEVRMYVLVGILGVFGLLRRRWLFNLSAAGLLVFYLTAPQHFFLLQKLSHERLGLYFLLGSVAYVNRDLITYHWLGVITLGLVAVSAFDSRFYDPLFALCFAYTVLYLSFHEFVRLPDLAARGDLSYGLYLYAFPVTQTWIWLLQPQNPWVLVALVFCTALFLAAVSWHFVEKPCLALKGRLSSFVTQGRAGTQARKT